MVILVQQLSELVLDVVGDMSNGQAGTDNTLFVKTQTGLQTAVVATNVALIDATSTVSSISVTHFLSTSVGNGSTLVEFEVNDGSGTSYNRSVKASVAKTANIELFVPHTFDFEVIV